MAGLWSRRDFLGGMIAAGGGVLVGWPPAYLTADLRRWRLETTTLRLFTGWTHDHGVGPVDPWWALRSHRAAVAGSSWTSTPETPRIRALQFSSICQAPLYVAESFLKAEGFTDVQYVPTEGGVVARNLARGEVDIGLNFIAPNLIRLEAGDPIVILAGGHVGCFELFGTPKIRAVRDLKGKAIALAYGLEGPEHVFLSTMLAYVGVDPRNDVTWVTLPRVPTVAERITESVRLLVKGEVDAFLAFPPTGQDLRARNIGHVVVNSTTDRPWSQYFCCLVVAHREFVRKYPVATKRALRAILKTADFMRREPAQAARLLVARFEGSGIPVRYDYALQLMKEIPYGKWRDYDPEDAVRFYALRLLEAGMIKSSPQKIIAEATDWRFLNELKKEMKG